MSSTVETKRKADPVRSQHFHEGQADEMFIHRHRPATDDTRRAILAMIERMKKNHRDGDVAQYIQEFRNNPRGE